MGFPGVEDLYDRATGLALAPDGSVYVTGYFEGTVDFDPGPGTHNLSSVDRSDVFVLKLDSDGRFVWARSMGGTWYEYGKGIAVGPDGSVCVTGEFHETADLDPGPGTWNLISAGASDVFLVKLDSEGHFVWARQVGGTGGDIAQDVAVAADGSVYFSGTFSGTGDFDPGPGTWNLTSAGYQDVFIAKLDSEGRFLWAGAMGGPGEEYGSTGIAVDGDGGVLVTGNFDETADFDPGPGTCYLTSAGGGDAFVVRLDPEGRLVWALCMGGSADDGGRNVALGADGRVHLVGYFSGTADFDSGPDTWSLTGAGSSDVFAVTLDALGRFIRAGRLGGPAYDGISDLALGPDGSLIVVGMFYGTADFDPGPSTWNLTSAGGADAFIWKLRADYAPADVTLSPASVPERSPTGTVVGQLAAAHPVVSEICTFELLDSAGGRFMLVGNEIRVDNGELLDYAQAAHHQITVRARDSLGVAFEKTLTISLIPADDVAPQVTGVFVRGSAWSAAFLAGLDALGLGHPTVAGLGYRVPVGADSWKPLPWTGLDTITLVFDEDVIVGQDDLSLLGVAVAAYDLAGGTFTYDSAAHAATWTLPQAVAADKLLAVLSDAVTDAAGNRLDGEWSDGQEQFPSGDDLPGGHFVFRFHVLPGDVTQDGMVISNDMVWLIHALGSVPGDAAYRPLSDLNGDGMTISNDVALLLNRLGTTLPEGEPALPEPPAGQGSSAPGDSLPTVPDTADPGEAEQWAEGSSLPAAMVEEETAVDGSSSDASLPTAVPADGSGPIPPSAAFDRALAELAADADGLGLFGIRAARLPLARPLTLAEHSRLGEFNAARRLHVNQGDHGDLPDAPAEALPESVLDGLLDRQPRPAAQSPWADSLLEVTAEMDGSLGESGEGRFRWWERAPRGGETGACPFPQPRRRPVTTTR